MMRYTGRQTQFYIDVVYGIAFSLGFGYLLFYGMEPRIAAFEGGLVLGYFLRVWENMTVYERVLEAEVAEEAEEAVAEEAEEAVAEEVAERVPAEAEAQVAGEVVDQVQEEVEAQVPGEVENRVQDEVEDRVRAEVEDRVPAEVETELIERVGEIDEGLATELEERLEEHLDRERRS